MQKDNNVIFKGGKNGIVIVLAETAEYEELCESLRVKARGAINFFSNATTSIAFKGKLLTESQLLNLIDIISEETHLNIAFVEDLTGEFKINNEKNESKKNTKAAHPPMQKEDTYFHKGGLRSGQAISHGASVVVLGDVNAGAQIVAGGNVIVFGAIRGMVHAGEPSNTNAFVVALSLQPTQLRIADIITYFPKEIIQENKNKLDPVYAYITDGEIYISPITN